MIVDSFNPPFGIASFKCSPIDYRRSWMKVVRNAGIVGDGDMMALIENEDDSVSDLEKKPT